MIKSSWYSLSLIAIFSFSVCLRFWNLGQFNELVFDEVYYAKFANNYLTNTNFFNAHPPLSQYIIAIGIWLGSFIPAPPEMMNTLTGTLRSTFSYHWINALSGSFIPLLMAALTLKLTNKKSYSVLAALLLALDGMFLVESRYALNNIYIVIFGLLGHLFFITYLSNRSYPLKNLLISGIFLGGAACIKWNGLWFLLGIYLMIILGFLFSLSRYPLNTRTPESWLKPSSPSDVNYSVYPLNNLTEINPLYPLIILTVTAAITYSVLWIPHLILVPEYNFWQMQKEILSYHERIKSGFKIHPYCSTWYSWILMLRPIAYYYKRTENNIIYDVHAMANPFLLWLSSGAIIGIMFWLGWRLWQARKHELSPINWLLAYFIVNYLANLLPWVRVTRCIFFYHYLGSYTFAILGLAWLIDTWLSSRKVILKLSGTLVLIIVVIGFVYWLPIFLGMPISQTDFNIRMFSNPSLGLDWS